MDNLSNLPNPEGFFGEYGGKFVPETLMYALKELDETYASLKEDQNFLNEIDVYALVSGMDLAPLTLKEAQLMQKPVVATNAGGIPEMMKDGETGFLVEEGDHDEWIKHLTNTINDEDLSKRLGKEGQRFVKETFSWERIAENFVKILNKYQ